MNRRCASFLCCLLHLAIVRCPSSVSFKLAFHCIWPLCMRKAKCILLFKLLNFYMRRIWAFIVFGEILDELLTLSSTSVNLPGVPITYWSPLWTKLKGLRTDCEPQGFIYSGERKKKEKRNLNFNERKRKLKVSFQAHSKSTCSCGNWNRFCPFISYLLC